MIAIMIEPLHCRCNLCLHSQMAMGIFGIYVTLVGGVIMFNKYKAATAPKPVPEKVDYASSEFWNRHVVG